MENEQKYEAREQKKVADETDAKTENPAIHSLSSILLPFVFRFK